MTNVQISLSQKGGLVGVRRWDLVAVTINGIIGSHLRSPVQSFFRLISGYSLIAFVACGARRHADHSVFRRKSAAALRNWQSYLYARRAFGPTVAFEVGWLVWLARLAAFAANCNLIVKLSLNFARAC
jgi:hypothetical protein